MGDQFQPAVQQVAHEACGERDRAGRLGDVRPGQAEHHHPTPLPVGRRGPPQDHPQRILRLDPRERDAVRQRAGRQIQQEGALHAPLRRVERDQDGIRRASPFERRRAQRCPPLRAGRFERVGEANQAGVVERAAEQLEPCRNLRLGEPGRHGERRQPRVRAQRAGGAHRGRPDERGLLAHGRVGERVQFIVVHETHDRLPEGLPAGHHLRVLVGGLLGAGDAPPEGAVQSLVVETRLHDLLERRHRSVRDPGQVVHQVELELQVDQAGACEQAVQAGDGCVYHLGAQRVHPGQRGAHDLGDPPSAPALLQPVGQHADAGALQRGRVESVLEAGGRAPLQHGRGGIGGVRPDRRVQRDRQVGHGARERAAGVLRVRERQDAVDARQPLGRPQPEQVVHRRRDADRAAGVTPPPHRREARGHRRPRPPRAPARVARGLVGVAALPAQRTDGGDPGRELVQVGLPHDDGARLAQPRHLEGVVGRPEPRERQTRPGGRHPGHVVVVLHQHRNAVHRPAHRAVRPLPVERLGLRARLRIEPRDRVQLRPGDIVRRNAVEIEVDQLPRADPPLLKRPLQVRDRRFRDLEVGDRGPAATSGDGERDCGHQHAMESLAHGSSSIGMRCRGRRAAVRQAGTSSPGFRSNAPLPPTRTNGRSCRSMNSR